MPLNLAIVGRPNVGKSTLFNRLAGKSLAIIDDTPGVTRDRAFAPSDFQGLQLTIVDTAGFETGAPESISARMTAQTETAIRDADVCLFLIDARAGVTTGDEIIAQTLRKSGKPVILAANKCEGNNAQAGAHEAFRLGFGEPIALSAAHGLGLSDLRAALLPFAGEEQGEEETAPEDEAAPSPLRLAIVGRPNVGKSSLLNRLLGEDRSLTGPEAGITRDAVLAEWHYGGREILLHDTAGMRRKARITERLEKLSVGSTLNAVRFADCVILVMDVNEALEKQDLIIADLIEREGRAILFAANKWDTVSDRPALTRDLRERVDRQLPQLEGAAIVGVSALTGEGIDRLMQAVLEADRVWNTRAGTHKLNRFLETALARHPPPAIKGRRVRIRYMTEVKARPPTFALFGNQLKALPQSYLRYLTHGLREAFGLPGTPIRLSLRESKNPYTDK